MSTNEEIVSSIMSKMPSHAEKVLSEQSLKNYILTIYWKLNNDPKRPNKMSKTITIFIPRELLDDYPNFSEAIRDQFISNLESHISSLMQGFDPNHDSPKYVDPPLVQWDLPLDKLF